MFNPVVSHFRIHFFSARPCFNFSTGASLSDFGKSFMAPEKYYASDPEMQQPSPAQPSNGNSKSGGGPQPAFSLHRLGRRSQYDRLASTRNKAHKFWSAYMSKVADDEHRGRWLGLAPLRAQFKDMPQHRLLRLRQDSIQPAINAALQPTQSQVSLKLSAFPKLYLCPIGWAAGVVVDVKGDLPFEKLHVITDLVRTQPVFVFRNEPNLLQLDQVLIAMHRMVRDALLVTDRRHPANEAARSYMVCSPLTFQSQLDFAGDEDIDVASILRVLEQNPSLADEDRRTVSPTPRSFTVTRFNRGTMRITATLGDLDHQSPECALSNLKNCLLMTALMEQFHSDAAGHASPAVQQMREEVELTFALLKNAWKSPHFHTVCKRDSGLLKMMKSAVTNVFNFIHSNFQDVAIGDSAKIVAGLDPARRSVYLSSRREMEKMESAADEPDELYETKAQEPVPQPVNSIKEATMASKYSFTSNTITNAAIGDNATQIVQGWSTDELQKFAQDLLRLKPEIEKRAVSPEQKQDAQTVEGIRQDAAQGNRSAVIEKLKKLGKWGWDTLKELGVSIAVETLKKAVGF